MTARTVAAALCVGFGLVTCRAEMKTPETSRFFSRHVDPDSGVVSWILKPGIVAHNQQHFYFTAKSMTDDGRFLMFHAADDEFSGRPRRKNMKVLDFLTDEVIDLPDVPGGCTPFADPKTDQIWYVKDDGLCRRDLLADPRKEIRLCDFAPEVLMPKEGYGHYCTHLTLTPDRTRCFLDWCSAGGKDWYGPNIKARQLVVDVATGRLVDEWGTGDFWINHGQLNPVNPDLAMCAYEGCSKKWVRGEDGQRVRVPRGDDEVYPRIILVEKGKRTFVRSKVRNYATHEHWTEDGTGFYWCASGVHYCDLATGRQRCICPLGSAHATVTADNRYITSDCDWGGWWRGCGWTTSFYNRDTHQGLYIHTRRPVYAAREKPSALHPDPHPQFVCADRYICCTMNVKEHQMTVSLTPVAPLVEMTSRPLPPPRRVRLDWHARRDVSVPSEIEFSWKKLLAAGVVAPLEKSRYLSICPESFGVEATLADGSRRRVPVTALPGRFNEERPWDNEFVVLRFTPPAGAVALDLLAGVGGRFEIEDPDGCDNLFAGAIDAANAGRWSVTKGGRAEAARHSVLLTCEKAGSACTATYAQEIPAEAAGKPCKLDMEVRSLSGMTWAGPIVIRQLDAQGRQLPEYLVDPRWTGHMRPPNKTAFYRETGFIHKDARKLVVSAQLRYEKGEVDDYGLPLDRPDRLQPKLLITRLIVRPAAVLPFPGYTDAHFAPGVTDDPADSSIRLGGENAFCYQTRSHASWAQGTPMRRDDQVFFPRKAGTVEAWFRPAWDAAAETAYTLIEAVHSAAHVEEAYHAATRGPLVEVTYRPKSATATLALRDFAGRRYVAKGRADIPSGAWTHVACTFAPDGEAVLWVNGRRTLATPLTGFVPFELEKAKFPNDAGPVEVWLGGSWRSGRVAADVNPEFPFLPGCADLLRVSAVERYRADFTPERTAVCDAETCALFGFDRDYDGRTARGQGWISGSYRSMTPRQSRTIAVDGVERTYYPSKLAPEVDYAKVLDNYNYKVLPGTAEADAARRAETKTWTLKAGDTVSLDCPKGVVTDYIEYRNAGNAPLVHPLLVNRGDIDPRSFGDIADTLVATCRNDREKANRIFNFVMKASNYSQSHHPIFHPGSDVPRSVEYEALLMLNGYCGFECGPLNSMAKNIFAVSGGMPAAQTAGYGHSFEEVFYNGKNRIYDLSARKFFPAMDNETVADLGDADREFGVIARCGSRVGGFCRNGNRGHGTSMPSYQRKCGMTLNPGESFRMWRLNDGFCNDLQLNSCWPGNRRTISRPTCFYKTDAAADCRAQCPTNTWRYGVKDEDLGRVDRFFPEFANGFLVFDGRPAADNPAFTRVEDGSFCYLVRSCYPIVHAEYAAETAGGAAKLELSTDRGATWFALATGADGRAVVDYPVRARHEYLVRVQAPIAAVTRFAAKTEVQANRRIMPGELRGGANELTFRADSANAAEVTVGYRVGVKPIEVRGAVFTGAIPGCERLLALVDPVRPLRLEVKGASPAATVRARGGVEAALKDGALTVSAGRGEVPRLAAVDIVDGEAEKQLTLLVAADARLVTAAEAKLAGGARLLGRDGAHANACAMLAKPSETARFAFAPLPKGTYAVLGLTRYQSKLEPVNGHYDAGANDDVRLLLPGLKSPVPAGSQESLPDAYWWTPMGCERAGERGNFKWEYAVDPHSYYPYQMMRAFELPEGADFAEFSNPKAFPGGVEVAAVLVLPEPSRDFKAMLRKVLCGYNCEPWRVK